MDDQKKSRLFLWKNMPRMDVPASQTFEDFLDSARRRHVFEGSYEITLKQIAEAQATFFDAWVWKGCRDSKRMAEFYELLEEQVRINKKDWEHLLGQLENRPSNNKKGNYLIANREMVKALDRITEKRNEDSSVNTKSISGDTDDDAASLASEPIHKRLDHSDK